MIRANSINMGFMIRNNKMIQRKILQEICIVNIIKTDFNSRRIRQKIKKIITIIHDDTL